MFINMPMKCSKCGSSNYETFSNMRASGIRCLDCGHEKVDSKPMYENKTESTKYVSYTKIGEF